MRYAGQPCSPRLHRLRLEVSTLASLAISECRLPLSFTNLSIISASCCFLFTRLNLADAWLQGVSATAGGSAPTGCDLTDGTSDGHSPYRVPMGIDPIGSQVSRLQAMLYVLMMSPASSFC